MSSAVLSKSAESLLSGQIDLLTDDVKVSLVDLDTHGEAVVGATNATPIVMDVPGHGLSNGDRVLITGVQGNTAANGVFFVSGVAGDNFSLLNAAGQSVAGNGAYTSGGVIISLENDEFFSDLTGVIGSSSNLSGKTVTRGVFDANDLVILSVSGATVECLYVWVDTGNPATSPLVGLVTGTVTPDGNNVAVTFNASGILAIT
jgi:hypothetical protein